MSRNERVLLQKKNVNTLDGPSLASEELGPLLFLGRRSETGASWLSDAGEYCGDTGEDWDAGVLLNCEYGGDTGENCEAGV